MAKMLGCSYQKRVADINRIYDRYARTGLSNREIWRRYIYPEYGISERTLYRLLKAPSTPTFQRKVQTTPGLFDLIDYGREDT